MYSGTVVYLIVACLLVCGLSSENPTPFKSHTSLAFVGLTQQQSSSSGHHSLRYLGETSLGTPGADPVSFVYSSQTGMYYVAASSGWLDFVSSSSYRDVRSVYLGNQSRPASIAYDASNNTIFVGVEPRNIIVVSATDGEIVRNVSVQSEPIALSYDSVTGNIYAGMGLVSAFIGVGTGDYNVTLVNASTYRISQIPTWPRIPVFYPSALTVDPAANLLIALGPASVEPWNGVAAFNASTGAILWYLNGTATGPDYVGLALDFKTKIVYLPDCRNDTVVGLNESTGLFSAKFDIPTLDGACDMDSVVSFDSETSSLILGGPWTPTILSLNVSSGLLAAPLFVGGDPSAITPDAGGGHPAVLTFDSATIAVLGPNDSSVAELIDVGSGPLALALDPESNLVYAADSNNVSLVNATTRKLVGYVSVGAYPSAVMFDPAGDEVFVANADSDTVSVITAGSNTVVASIPVDATPWSFAIDDDDNTVFVACMNLTSPNGVGYIDEISGTTLNVTARFAVGIQSFPDGLAYVPPLGDLFVSHAFQEYAPYNLTVLSAATGQVVGSVPLPNAAEPGVLEYDNSTGLLYAANAGIGNNGVNSPDDLVVDPLNLSVVGSFPVGAYPAGLGLSATMGLVFGASFVTGNVSAIAVGSLNITAVLSLGPGALAYSLVTDAAASEVIVGEWGQNTLVFLQYAEVYAVEFNESGLRPGTNWTVNLDGSNLTTENGTLLTNLPNGSAEFSVNPVPDFSANPQNGTLTISGAGAAVTLKFSRTYHVEFITSGLPPGEQWTVHLGSSSDTNRTTPVGGTIDFTEPNGTYAYSISTVPGYRLVSIPPSGNLDVAGSNLTENLEYNVSVFELTVSEFGLPANQPWSITIGGQVVQSTVGVALVSLANGSYPYVVGSLAGWHLFERPYAGTINVSGSNESLFLNWSRTLYATTFEEAGLPAGTTWSVALTNGTSMVNVTSVTLQLPNGSFDYSISPPAGYVASPSSGVATVDGQNSSIAVAFHPVLTTNSGTELPPWLAWTILTLAAAAVAIIGVVFWRRHHQPRGGPPAGESFDRS